MALVSSRMSQIAITGEPKFASASLGSYSTYLEPNVQVCRVYPSIEEVSFSMLVVQPMVTSSVRFNRAYSLSTTRGPLLSELPLESKGDSRAGFRLQTLHQAEPGKLAT